MSGKKGASKVKETVNAETGVVEATLELTPAQEQILATFNEDDRKAFDSLDAVKKVEMLQFLVEESEAVATDLGGLDFDSADVQNLRDDIMMVSPNGPLCRPGKVFHVELLGTMPMWSLKKQTGWKEHTAPNGKKFYTSHYYVAKDIRTGKKLGFYRNPILVKYLTKIPTADSNRNVHTNPKLRITYIGLIVGEEKLAAEYDLVIGGGDKAHVFAVDVEKGLKFNKYRPGVINYLENPTPNFGEKEEISDMDRAARDWEQLELINGGVAAVGQLEGGASVALPETTAHQ